ncbi:LPS export ABC transporter periplasmic protein LptC [Pseudomonas xionganensis]|uniref:Lipopolysaccharide export system protein LptC n=1 Tax=Pseudomonas xionganensis TaxID=2654845 RepID=A0A6I4KSR9_9PSED|nr:LPS export ABC transporter periplasmic protein LptC [Pseudomonas xionganensis]MVW74741.1 LPS export ABC transporter periplasmic protein LptC [Pseudomonas xionganensis]
MLRKPLNIAILACAALLLAALGYWNISPDNLSGQNRSVTPQDTVDFYTQNTTTVQYMADGTVHYRVTAERTEHLQTTDITLVSQPRLTLYRGKELPWNIKSERAEISPGGAEVELIDQVRIDRTDEKGRPTILTTTRLTVFPEKDYAQTRQAVRIDAANGVTTAQGMKAYLNDGRMHLLSNVRGQHEAR